MRIYGHTHTQIDTDRQPNKIPNRTNRLPHVADTRVVRQPPWYYGLEQRTFTHPRYNRTSIRLPKSFYEDHLDTLDQVKVVYTAYNELHCIANSVPW